MKFDFYCERSAETAYQEIYHFHYTLTRDEIEKTLWNHGDNLERFNFHFPLAPLNYKMSASLGLIRESFLDDEVDLGINYKKKYEELSELLKPYRIEENMEPSTTLKMILKYSK